MNEVLNLGRVELVDSKEPSHLAFELAHAFAEQRRHGVLWWWKLIGHPQWTKSTVQEIIGRKECGDSLNSFEGAPENRVRRTIWPFHVLFTYRYERSAFLYEMKARITGEFEKHDFDKPWIELTPDQRESLARRWPMDEAGLRAYKMCRPLWKVMRSGTKPDQGWTAYQNISWNLNHNNAKLLREFKIRLNSERERLGQQRKVNQGTKHRIWSWRPIELIDQRQFEQKVWSDGERSQVRKAINKATGVFNRTSN
jgi:hypothetical protein